MSLLSTIMLTVCFAALVIGILGQENAFKVEESLFNDVVENANFGIRLFKKNDNGDYVNRPGTLPGECYDIAQELIDLVHTESTENGTNKATRNE